MNLGVNVPTKGTYRRLARRFADLTYKLQVCIYYDFCLKLCLFEGLEEHEQPQR